MRNARRQQGFNMIELLVVMALGAILAGMAVPSFTSMLDRRAVAAEANRLVRSINLARSKAVNAESQLSVSIESTSGTAQDWSNGWRVFIDADNNPATAYNAATDEVLADIVLNTRALSIRSSANASTSITFTSQGRLTAGLGQVDIGVCDSTRSGNIDGSLVTISATGRTTVTPILAASQPGMCVPP